MAEFDGGGFAAVQAFFGDDVKDDEPQEKPIEIKQKRLGVGAAAPIQTTTVSAKRILQVGQKGDDSDDDDEQKSSDDEEPGRTGIAEKVTAPKEEPPTKPKKKGKKERQKDAQRKDHTATPETTAETPVSEEVATSNKKRKRRKVRSRQKNIAKDHRLQKPDHIVPGQSHYRPLTTETRAKVENTNPALLPVKPRTDKLSSSESPAQPPTKTRDTTDDVPKKSKKRKKSKYKNLIINQ